MRSEHIHLLRCQSQRDELSTSLELGKMYLIVVVPSLTKFESGSKVLHSEQYVKRFVARFVREVMSTLPW